MQIKQFITIITITTTTTTTTTPPPPPPPTTTTTSTTTTTTTTTTTATTTTTYTITTTTSRIIQIFQLWYTLGLFYLNLIWIAKFRYEWKIEMASARHIKMTHSCSWPVVYISASISFLYVRKKPLWFSQEILYQSPRVS